MVRLRRAFSDALVSAAVLGSLMLALVAADGRVRDHVMPRFGGPHPSTALTHAGGQVRDIVAIVVEAVRDQSVEHAPLLIFVLVATALLLAMSRT
ncbi:MAG: hypothetical protein HY047_15460 [Acidobacteria bacterium]|nr:hypothetical protein [Acidobacteriota bacterium]